MMTYLRADGPPPRATTKALGNGGDQVGVACAVSMKRTLRSPATGMAGCETGPPHASASEGAVAFLRARSLAEPEPRRVYTDIQQYKP
jgi:hypothetical protein